MLFWLSFRLTKIKNSDIIDKVTFMKKIYLVSLIFFLIDLITKIVVINIDEFPIEVINNFFYLEKVFNRGAAFSMFYGYGLILILVTVFVIYYINKHIIKDIKTKFGAFSVGILLGGILGNLFDRIFYGEVVDFLSFYIFEYSFPVCNFADIFICLGTFMLVIEFLRGDLNGNSIKG